MRVLSASPWALLHRQEMVLSGRAELQRLELSPDPVKPHNAREGIATSLRSYLPGRLEGAFSDEFCSLRAGPRRRSF